MNARTRAITDIALAAYLIAAGHHLQAVRHERSRGVFVFVDSPELEQAVMNYLNRRATVDALTFHETVRNLKAAGQAA